MKIGVISDTHIPDRCSDLPDKVLEEFAGLDLIIHAGDFVDLKSLQNLQKSCKNVEAVLGNMDSDELKKILPLKKVINLGKFKIGVMHGYGRADKLIDVLAEAFKDDGVDMVIFGHSHVGTNIMRDGVIYFNPGSPTDHIFAPCNSYGIVEINDHIEARIVQL